MIDPDEHIEAIPAPKGKEADEAYEYGIRRKKDGYYLRYWIDSVDHYKWTPDPEDGAIWDYWRDIITSPEANEVLGVGENGDYIPDEGYEIVRRPYVREDMAPGD